MEILIKEIAVNPVRSMKQNKKQGVIYASRVSTLVWLQYQPTKSSVSNFVATLWRLTWNMRRPRLSYLTTSDIKKVERHLPGNPYLIDMKKNIFIFTFTYSLLMALPEINGEVVSSGKCARWFTLPGLCLCQRTLCNFISCHLHINLHPNSNS